MSEHRFGNLQEALIRRGVAVRFARRAMLEIEAHHRDLLEAALCRGESPEQARRSADAAIGTDSTLIERFASRKELRSWSYRWPAGYGLAPILCFAGLGFGLMYALWRTLHAIWPHSADAKVSAAVATHINFAMSAVFLWLLPISLGMGFALLAYRRRICLRWPIAGILLLCAVAALVNVGFGVRGGPHPLFLEAGIGFAAKTLPEELARALSKAALALIPLAWLKFCAESRRPSLS